MSLRAINLYFFFQPSCPACVQAKKFLETFKQAHPTTIVIPCDMSKKNWAIAGYSPKATPSYLITLNREEVFTHSGTMSDKQLGKVFDQIDKAAS